MTLYLLYIFVVKLLQEIISTLQGRGFNTGVILLDLQKLRDMKWMELWKQVAEKELVTMQHTSLADQVINCSVAKWSKALAYGSPCLSPPTQ